MGHSNPKLNKKISPPNTFCPEAEERRGYRQAADLYARVLPRALRVVVPARAPSGTVTYPLDAAIDSGDPRAAAEVPRVRTRGYPLGAPAC